MATPTAALPAVSYASIPAMPAAKATSTVPGPISVSEGPSTLSAISRPLIDPPEDPQQHRHARRSQCGDPEADAQRECGACGERPPPLDEPDGGSRDREQVGAQRHRPDDEDRRALEYADPRHDAGRRHEEDVQEGCSGVLRRPPGDLGPHRRVAPGCASVAASIRAAECWSCARGRHRRRRGRSSRSSSSTSSATSTSSSPVSCTMFPAVRPPTITCRTPATAASCCLTDSARSGGT